MSDQADKVVNKQSRYSRLDRVLFFVSAIAVVICLGAIAYDYVEVTSLHKTIQGLQQSVATTQQKLNDTVAQAERDRAAAQAAQAAQAAVATASPPLADSGSVRLVPLWFAFFTAAAVFVLFFLLVDIIHRCQLLWVQRKYRRIAGAWLSLEEGNFRKAERLFLLGVDTSAHSLANYLGAAKAAQQLGAISRRDDYLMKANQVAPRSGLVVGIMQAEFEIDSRQYAEAMATLQRLREIAPRNSRVLTLFAKVHLLSSTKVAESKEIEKLTRKLLRYEWQPDLVLLYGMLSLDNLNRQLVTAGEWLKQYGQKQELLLTLGRLCVKAKLWGKAKDYFERCIAQGPNLEASLALSQLQTMLGRSTT